MCRVGLLTALGVLLIGVVGEAADKPATGKPKVEVVFCLDTTGSMGGLIEGAKAKIWSLCNQIVSGKPTPDLRVGLVAYRDKGDAYVTQIYDLSDDLDGIHAKLKTFTAGGGGDEPEHVNQALYDAVHKIKWSDDKRTLKIIFLVGDAVPHMDYTDDVKYPQTCQKAVEKGIIINAIQCGGSASCAAAWKDIASKAEGSYAAIPQSGGVVAIATPFDAELAKLNRELDSTTLAYGGESIRKRAAEALSESRALAPAAAADRAAFAGRTGKTVKGDLLDALKRKEVTLQGLKETELPEELRKLKTLEQRQEYLNKIEKQREELSKKAVELDKKRAEYIAQELKKKGKDAKDSFDTSVLDMLRKQAKKFGIAY